MKLPLVLMAHPLPTAWIASLEGRVQLFIGPPDPPGFAPELLDRINEAEGMVSMLIDKVDEALLARAPRLRVVSNYAVGFDNIDVPACTRRKIPIGNTPGVLTDATADLAMALLLSTARGIAKAEQDARNGLWRIWTPTGWLGADLRGAMLGIIGMGKIGTAVAQRAKGFGMNMVYHKPNRELTIESGLGIQYLALDELLQKSDFVTLHCPLNPQTRGLINEAALRKMKRTAILINTARGPVIDTAALVRALQEGWIAGAGIDVTDPEPLPKDHPLYNLPNCLVSPHIGSATHGTRRRMAEIACENLLAGLEGRRLLHCVNKEIYEEKK